jgi:hypothetical protein
VPWPNKWQGRRKQKTKAPSDLKGMSLHQNTWFAVSDRAVGALDFRDRIEEWSEDKGAALDPDGLGV